jgi:hypothetical protein
MTSVRSQAGKPALLGLATLMALWWAGPSPSAEPSSTISEARSLSDMIDQQVVARWVKLKVQEAPRADDAEFVRRIYLDLAGRIPRFTEVRDFLADPAVDKREKLIDHLLESPVYVANFTAFWRSLLIPQNASDQVQGVEQQLTAWIRDNVRANTPYNEMVHELLTAPLNTPAQPDDVKRPRRVKANWAAVFFQANEFKPENLAAATSRLFLGMKLECASCHDHPFDKWKRKQFWEFTAFFSGVQPTGDEVKERREIMIPSTGATVSAGFLDGTRPSWKPDASTRETLADWVTSPNNPYFARTIVNRMWAHFMGTGIVDPVDDFTIDNMPTHPELLDVLAKQFVAHKYDLKYLIRAITLSKTYQLTSKLTHPSQLEPGSFARMSLKGLTAEQFFDSLALATGYRETEQSADPRRFGGNSPRADFLARFANTVGRRTEPQTSILQALAMMNGRFVQDLTSVDRGELLGAVIDFPHKSDTERVEVLYLSTLSRQPRPEELARTLKYIETGGPGGDKRKAIADVFWALLNSSEFLFNH